MRFLRPIVTFDCYCRDDVERLAKECRMRLYRTSVKEDLNVGSVFQHLAENYVNKVKSYNEPNNMHEQPLFQIGASSRSYSTSGYGHQGPLYTQTKPMNNRRGNNNNNTANGYMKSHSTSVTPSSNGYVPSMYSNGAPHRQRLMSTVDPHAYHHRAGRNGGVGTNGFYHHSTSSGSSFSPQDYLNNPMFDSLNHHRRYWPHDRTITLRPLSGKRSFVSRPRNACRVLS